MELRGLPWDVKTLRRDSPTIEDDEAVVVPEADMAGKEPDRKNYYVTRGDVRKYGPTVGCGRCSKRASPQMQRLDAAHVHDFDA